jgi:hypothetical protein
MALTYADQGTLVANVAWQKRIAAAVADVTQNTITKLAPNTPNYYRLQTMAQATIRDEAATLVFARLVAAGFGGGVTALATPVEATGTDAALGNQVLAAFNAFAVV